MKDLLALLILQLPAGILCGGSIWLASQGKAGWGWMLLGAMCLAVLRVGEFAQAA